MTAPLRVAMLIQRYAPLVGGAERLVGSLAPALNDQGVAVTVLTRRYAGLASYEVIDGVPVHRLPVPGPKASASLSYTVSALSLLKKIQPHIIHAHELFSPTTTAVAARLLLGRVPVVTTLHRSGPIGDVQRLQRKLLGRQRIDLFRREVDCFLAISREIDDELASVGIPESRREFISNAVDTNRFHPAEEGEKTALRASLGLPVEAVLAVFTGRLAPEKRVNNLLAVWPAVRAAQPDAHLLVIGSGPEEARLRQMVGEGVQFLGSIDNVAPYLRAADLFVLPSAAEGLSVALLEAMSCGLPALITRVGGAEEVVTDRENGWLIPPDDLPALQTGLQTLLGSAQLRAEYGRSAREQILAHYRLESVVAQLRALYQRLSVNGGAA